MTNPWMKFYPADWRSDPRLRMCSLAARGLWIEMIALMHEAEPYGHLLISGNAPTDAQLAVLAGTLPDQIPGLLGELESAGVFSRTQKGVVFSRRMTRDEKKSRLARKNGKSGGNPSLGKQSEFSPPDNPKDKAGDILRSQKPEARSQNNKTHSDPPGSTFDELWKAYPHPSSRGQKPIAKFEKLSLDEKAAFRDAIPILKTKLEADHKRGFQRQAPMFATYLNQRRWETEAEDNQQKSKPFDFSWTERVGAA